MMEGNTLDKKNIDLMCALHLDRPDHLHFHFVFWEKEPKYKGKDGVLSYRRKGKIEKTAIASAGVWSIVMGVFFAIAQKNEDKEKARKMIKNYVIGLVVIFAILVACPYLVKGIAALIAG